MKRRILVLASLALVGLTNRAPAQEPEYVDNLRFVHELRQRGDTDLAIDLLNRLATSGSNEIKKELPYELALCSKAEAVNEPDSGKRLRLYAKAREDLIKFRDSNPNHPRLAETKIDIAEITVLEGKTEISRAMAREGIEAQSAGLLDARKKFEAAAIELKSINDELEAKLASLGEPKTPDEKALKAKLTKTHLRAELSVALNLFDVAQSYHRDGSDAVLRERADKVKEAVKALQKVAANDDTLSEVWQARAWLGRCEQELGEPKKARRQFEPIILARSAAAADGKRVARYFRLLVIQEQLKSGAAEKEDSIDTLIDGARRWITDYPRSLATPEGYGIRFLLADSLIQAAAGEKKVAKKKEYGDEARKLTSALAETENEYTDRARRMKIILIRQEGGFEKPVKDLKTFDECYVRAQFEIMSMGEDAQKIKDPKEREAKQKERVNTLIAALDRGLSLPGKAGNDVGNARAMLAFYNLTSGNLSEAIRIGRKFAEEDSRSAPAALAAAYALQAYGQLLGKREEFLKKAGASDFTDDQGGKITEAAYRALLEKDRAGMLTFCAYCEKTWPKELAGNLARHQIGVMNLRDEKIAEAIKVLNTITPEYPSYTAIQFLIGDISLKADLDKLPPFADQAKGEKAPVPFRERGLTALRSIPAPTGADPEQTRLYYQAKSRLGLELYRDKKFTEMEALAAPLLPKVATATFHPDAKTNASLREHFRTQLLKVQLFAKVGQADTDFKANALKKVADLADPVLQDLKAGTLMVPKSDPLVTQSLQALLSMALQANIQLGDLDKVKSIVEVYGKAIGEDPATVAVPEILKRLVPIIRNQVKELKAKGNFAAVDKAVKTFTDILDDLKKKQQPLHPEFLLVLSQCYGSLDKTDKAIEILEAIPKPKDGDVEGERVYQASRLAYLRQLRQVAANEPKKKEEIFKKASGLLNEWMGTKDKPGWASKSIDAHMERLYLYEMEDNTGGGFNKAQALVATLSKKITDPRDVVARDHYLECYYYMVYFLQMNGKKAAAGVRNQRTAEAASFLVALEEQYKDFGTEEMKKKVTALLNAEPTLKVAYEKAKKK